MNFFENLNNTTKTFFNKNLGKSQRYRGFTLSEVLITLGIIGVVAAFTIPTLQNSIQDYTYKVAYKKAFSDANQAILKANSDNILVIARYNTSDVRANFLAFMSEFETQKQCIDSSSSSNNAGCWNSLGEKVVGDNYPAGSAYAFIDSSGRSWSMYWLGDSGIFVDTNGFKGPNQWGKDRFCFTFYGQSNAGGSYSDIPLKFGPEPDYSSASPNAGTFGFICQNNHCGTYKDYYGTSWLYN